MTRKNTAYGLLVAVALILASCGGAGDQKTTGQAAAPAAAATNPDDPMQNKGIGPVKSVTLGTIDEAMVQEGKALYDLKCTACHKASEKFIGPAPKGIMSRRSPEWIMNMILNPEEMIQKDPIARKLLVESNLAPMANQHLTEAEARKILEYFRTLE